jgi:hypothetical protein
VANCCRPVTVPDIEIAQARTVLDEVKGRCGRPSDQAQFVEQGGVHRSGVRRGDEYDTPDGIDKGLRFSIPGSPAVSRAQDLLNQKSTKTVANEDDRQPT